MFKDLNSFIDALDKDRELARIQEPVSPDLEICAVTDRVSKSPGGGPALLFEKPTGYDMPVAINLYGSMTRMCMALGVGSLDDLAREIEELTNPKMPAGMLDTLKMLPMLARLKDLMPKTVGSAPCQEGLCLDLGTAQLCTKSCDTTHLCASGFSCQSGTLKNADGTLGASVSVCFPDGGGGTGSSCAFGPAACKSHLCLKKDSGNVCTQSCTASTDCPTSWQCAEESMTDGTKVQVCVPPGISP